MTAWISDSPLRLTGGMAGIPLMALGLLILLNRKRTPQSTLFAAFVLAAGFGPLVVNVWSSAHWAQWVAFSVGAVFSIVATLLLVLLLRHPPGASAPLPRSLLWAAVGLVAVLSLAIASTLTIRYASGLTTVAWGAVSYSIAPYNLASAAGSVLAAWAYLREPAEAARARRQLATFGAMLAFYPGAQAGGMFIQGTPSDIPLVGAVNMAAVLCIVAAWAWASIRRPDRATLLPMLAAPAVGLFTMSQVVLAGYSTAPIAVNGFAAGTGLARMLAAYTAAYGIFQHGLLDLDPHLRVPVPNSVATATFTGLMFVTIQAAVATWIDFVDLWILVVSSMLIIVALVPLHRAANRFSDRLPSNVAGPDVAMRARQVYRRALEDHLRSSDPAPAALPVASAAGAATEAAAEAAPLAAMTAHGAAGDARAPPVRVGPPSLFLAGLRDQLGLREEDHREVEAEVRADLGLPGGLLVGRYRIVRRLGEGASGEVFLARDEHDHGGEVAVKRLKGEQRRHALAMERFQREARVAASLDHPNLVRVEGVAMDQEDVLLVMAHLPGGSLEDRLADGLLAREEEAVAMAADLLAGLADLHDRGLLHRDVKPGNVLFDAEGRACLGDFTLARSVVSGDTLGLTLMGGPVGTLPYMAPEQVTGAPPDAAADLYGVAATVHAALTGRPPVELEGLDAAEARQRVLQGVEGLPLREASDALNAWLEKGLAKRPADRFPDAAAMRAALPGLPPDAAGVPRRGAAPTGMDPEGDDAGRPG